MHDDVTIEELIDQFIYDLQISCVENVPLLNVQGMYYSDSRGRFIFVDPSLETKDRIWIKLHELGHDRTFQDCSGTREAMRRNEYRANRFAYELIMPPTRLMEGLRLCDNIEELSDLLMIPERRIWQGLQMYESIYGPYIIMGSYALYWMPLRRVCIEAS